MNRRLLRIALASLATAAICLFLAAWLAGPLRFERHGHWWLGHAWRCAAGAQGRIFSFRCITRHDDGADEDTDELDLSPIRYVL